MIKAQKKGLPNKWKILNYYWCLGRESNSYSHNDRGILSPLRLPIPPPRHVVGIFNIFSDWTDFKRLRNRQKVSSGTVLPVQIRCKNFDGRRYCVYLKLGNVSREKAVNRRLPKEKTELLSRKGAINKYQIKSSGDS